MVPILLELSRANKLRDDYDAILSECLGHHTGDMPELAVTHAANGVTEKVHADVFFSGREPIFSSLSREEALVSTSMLKDLASVVFNVDEVVLAGPWRTDLCHPGVTRAEVYCWPIDLSLEEAETLESSS